MRKRLSTMKIIAGLSLAGLLAMPTLASTVYIDDTQNLVWPRTGPTKEYRVLPPIAPHTKLEALQVNQETGFTLVRDVTGREFWVENQFITNQPTSKFLLADALLKIQTLESAHQREVQTLKRQLADLKPLKTSNEELSDKIAQLESDLFESRQKSQLYERGFYSELFFAGAIVVIGGMILGWVLTKLGGRRRGGGWS